jgi:hypothetical protein
MIQKVYIRIEIIVYLAIMNTCIKAYFPETELYKILEITPQQAQDQSTIKRQYFKLQKKWHPDIIKGTFGLEQIPNNIKEANDLIIYEINEAYDNLVKNIDAYLIKKRYDKPQQAESPGLKIKITKFIENRTLKKLAHALSTVHIF